MTGDEDIPESKIVDGGVTRKCGQILLRFDKNMSKLAKGANSLIQQQSLQPFSDHCHEYFQKNASQVFESHNT